MKRTDKSTFITKNEKLMLIGLMALAKESGKRWISCDKMIAKTSKTEEGSHFSDQIWEDNDAPEAVEIAMKKCNIKVKG